MYTCVIHKEALEDIRKLALPKSKDGLISNIESLENDPHGRSKTTGIPVFAPYYINAGNRYCVLFDIDEDKKEVYIYKVLRQSLLYRYMKN